ncbi:MAG: hypothetical protein ABI650_08180, partial [Dokdonella sp.]
FGELTAEWIGVFDRHPQLLDALGGAHERAHDGAALGLVHAIAISVAVALPAYQALATACAPSDPLFDAGRQADCAISGARMAEHSPTLISRAIGIAVLRKLGDARYASAKRNWNYLQSQSIDLFDPALSHPEQMRRLIADWRETLSEVTVIERLLDRAGRPALPPADWQQHGDQATAAAVQQPAG